MWSLEETELPNSRWMEKWREEEVVVCVLETGSWWVCRVAGLDN